MKILITGACGTWGTEFVKQLKDRHEIIGIDNTEKAVADFRRQFPKIKMHLMDFVDWDFEKDNVDVTVHLAAYKHIDLAEVNVDSCISNNITKTSKFFKNANDSGVKILFISTDKAVEPISVYGLSKTLGERLAWQYGGQVARSGNIIGANGSVIHIWRDCVKNELPICVTDMKMKRYFIEVEDAVRISWDGFLKGKKLTIVDVGGKRLLKDIINDVLAESGKTIETYKPGIQIIGKRPGERLEDKIRWDDEKD